MAEPLLTDDQCALIRCLSKTHLTLLICEIEAHGWTHARALLNSFWNRPDYGVCMTCVQRTHGWPGRKPVLEDTDA